MPSNHRIRPDDDQRLAPPCPILRDPNPKQTIPFPKPRSFVIAAENRESLTKHEIFERQLATLPKPNTQQGNHAKQYLDHCCPACHRETRTSMLRMWTEYWQSSPDFGFWISRFSVGFRKSQCKEYITAKPNKRNLAPIPEKIRFRITAVLISSWASSRAGNLALPEWTVRIMPGLSIPAAPKSSSAIACSMIPGLRVSLDHSRTDRKPPSPPARRDSRFSKR